MDKKTDKILYSPKEGTTGFRGLRDVPEEPNWNLTSLSNDVKKGKYREALESCKSNGVEIVNPEVFRTIDVQGDVFIGIFQYLKPGDIFDLPEGYEFKDEYNCSDCPITNCSSTLCPKRVLRLVKTETKDFEWKDDMKLFDKKIDVAYIGHGQPESEESQDDYDRLNLRQTIITAMQDWVNQNERESIPRRGFNDFADKLTDTIQRKKQ